MKKKIKKKKTKLGKYIFHALTQNQKQEKRFISLYIPKIFFKFKKFYTYAILLSK